MVGKKIDLPASFVRLVSNKQSNGWIFIGTPISFDSKEHWLMIFR